jgi:beta-lactamase superfamily II metal-dependent hydrolase
VTLRNYSNRFGEFDDTNNLSLVTFLDVSGTRFALTGDIEEAGWLKLIQNAEVQRELQGTHVFFASHHGREGGYCRQVFDFCRPHVVVISDGAKQHATQETTSVYAQHASGISFGGATRSVLTTRSDGTFSWTW